MKLATLQARVSFLLEHGDALRAPEDMTLLLEGAPAGVDVDGLLALAHNKRAAALDAKKKVDAIFKKRLAAEKKAQEEQTQFMRP